MWSAGRQDGSSVEAAPVERAALVVGRRRLGRSTSRRLAICTPGNDVASEPRRNSPSLRHASESRYRQEVRAVVTACSTCLARPESRAVHEADAQ